MQFHDQWFIQTSLLEGIHGIRSSSNDYTLSQSVVRILLHSCRLQFPADMHNTNRRHAVSAVNQPIRNHFPTVKPRSANISLGYRVIWSTTGSQLGRQHGLADICIFYHLVKCCRWSRHHPCNLFIVEDRIKKFLHRAFSINLGCR